MIPGLVWETLLCWEGFFAGKKQKELGKQIHDVYFGQFGKMRNRICL